MKNQKGITMASLGVYIVVSIIVVATLATIMANYKTAIKSMDEDSEYASEYSKFNLYFLEETKKQENKEPEIENVENDYNSIKFETGNEFKYDIQKKILYLNKNTGEKIKLIKEVKTCTFKLNSNNGNNGKNVITVNIQIGETTPKTLEYVLDNNSNAELYSTENEYIEGIIKIPENWDSSKLNEKDPFRTEKIDIKYYIAPILKNYQVSTVEGENKISTGLIITNGTDRYKWYAEGIEELAQYTEETYGISWTAADSSGLTTNEEIYNSFKESEALYGGVYIKEDTEIIKTILWIK